MWTLWAGTNTRIRMQNAPACMRPSTAEPTWTIAGDAFAHCSTSDASQGCMPSSRCRSIMRELHSVHGLSMTAQRHHSRAGGRHSFSPRADRIRAYLESLRKEVGESLVGRLFRDPQAPCKYWMAFAARRLLDKSMAS